MARIIRFNSPTMDEFQESIPKTAHSDKEGAKSKKTLPIGDREYGIISRMKKIAVLMGGKSNEREVSLESGKNVAEALDSLGKYEVVAVDLTDDNLDDMPKDVDAVYISLHGGWGEDGGVQTALNALKIPYTGPGAKASRIAMDKIKTKMVLEMNNVPTPAWGIADIDTPASPLPLPVVVKPPCDGSSFGISKVSSPDRWQAALELAEQAKPPRGKNCACAQSRDQILVEEFIHGREMTVAVVAGKAWPAIEIVAKDGWYVSKRNIAQTKPNTASSKKENSPENSSVSPKKPAKPLAAAE